MKIILSIFIFATCLMFVSCNETKDGFMKTKSGLKYNIIESKNGAKPNIGDKMVMHILYKTTSDSILYDSKLKSDSFLVELVEPTFTGGVEEGFAMLTTGDSAVFKVPADSVFEKTFHSTLPEYLKPGSEMIFQVRLKSFLSKAVYDSIQHFRDIELRKEEFKNMDIYLEKYKMDVMPTENGAFVSIIKPGKDESPSVGDSVYVIYTGRLLDGTIFDQSVDREKPFGIKLGETSIIAGWEEAMPFFRKGMIARLVIPSDLGYGAQKYGHLPPYSTLIFDVEVMDIKKGASNK